MKTKFLFLVPLCIIALSACGAQASSTGQTDASPAPASADASRPTGTGAAFPSQADSTADTSANHTSKTIDFKTLLELIGKPDSEVTAVLGGGEAIKNEASALINRDYTLPLFGEEVSVSLYFNLYQEGAGLLEQCTINLNKPDLDGYEKILEGFLGKPSKTYEKSYFFTTDTAAVVLADPYDDVPYIEITSNSIH